ncbi:hypothetical protein [Janthinobacterium sp.]|uniref:hypothetical protein n=1 Tax=Janthinobacterium sp. TaxID=1871054 RepID=UPI00293D81D3|nr:hypothetical protein [Janthinobacterium sp.]
MQFDLQLAANGAQRIEVDGRFFKYKSGTGLIRVTTSKGEVVDLMPGQGVWNTQFSSLTVTDRTGAANAGVLMAGNIDFRDDRITGTVDVVDGGKARTLAGIAFGCSGYQLSVAGEVAHVEIWNPPGSGKNLIINTAVMASGTVGQLAGVSLYNAVLAVPANPAQNKKCGGGPGVASSFTKSQATQITNTAIWSMSSGVIYKPTEPIVVAQGWGLLFTGQSIAASLLVTAEYFEDPI